MEFKVDPELCESVRRVEKNFKACQKMLIAIGDENRQHLICEMMHIPIEGVRVAEITEKTHLSRPAVSHHMQILKDAGIVGVRKEGTYVYYFLDVDPGLSASLLQLAQDICDVNHLLPDRRGEE